MHNVTAKVKENSGVLDSEARTGTFAMKQGVLVVAVFNCGGDPCWMSLNDGYLYDFGDRAIPLSDETEITIKVHNSSL